MREQTLQSIRRLGDVLVEEERINPAQLQYALDLSSQRDSRLGETLIELGFIEEEELAGALARRLGVEMADLLRADSIDPSVLGLVPEELARARHLVAVRVEEVDGQDHLVVAMSDPTDADALKQIAKHTGLQAVPAVAQVSQIDAALESAYRDLPDELDAITAEMRRDHDREDAELPRVPSTQRHDEQDRNAPAVRYIDSLLYAALQREASDIHIEPQEFSTRVRFRIDGQLRNMPAPPRGFRDEVITRLKVISALDIAEHRKPQSGSLRVRYGGRSVDARVSSMPGVTGEKIVVRLLDQSRTRLRFEALGFERASVQRMRELIRAPHGIFLLCGPTGCGKTTTMYSFIRELDRHGNNIVTVEDPVEYHMPGVHQVTVRPNLGLSFAECLRTLLRQDPDIIMIGEVRDIETLQVAVRASLTGHPVFSTLHTNTAVSSVTRMANMGLQRYLIAATLNAALSQQLVRRVCPDCATRRPLKENEHADLRSYFGRDVAFEAPVAVGCERCDYSGYSGRIAVEELFETDEELREMISNRATELELSEAARARGMKSLIDHAIEKLQQGVTTVEEILSLGFHSSSAA